MGLFYPLTNGSSVTTCVISNGTERDLGVNEALQGFYGRNFFSVTTEQNITVNYRFYTFILTLLRRLQGFLVNDDYIFATCILPVNYLHARQLYNRLLVYRNVTSAVMLL